MKLLLDFLPLLLFFTRERRIRECPRHRCQCRLGPTITINHGVSGLGLAGTF